MRPLAEPAHVEWTWRLTKPAAMVPLMFEGRWVMKKVGIAVSALLIVALVVIRVLSPVPLMANGADTAAGVMQIIISFVLPRCSARRHSVKEV